MITGLQKGIIRQEETKTQALTGFHHLINKKT